MNAHDTSGPAFPSSNTPETGFYAEGMTLRDYFAANFAPVMIRMIADGLHSGIKRPVDEAAEAAYALADAMLKARQ